MKAVWLTDIHLNFLSVRARSELYSQIKETEADYVFITGDIAEARDVCMHLTIMAEALGNNQQILFVAGNHDYYFGSVKGMKEEFKQLSHGKIKYAPGSDVIKLQNKVYLCAVDGWADGRYGDYDNSPVVLNDSRLIKELDDSIPITGILAERNASLLREMQRLADEDAFNLSEKIALTLKEDPKKIIVLTHIPPFPESSLYQGKIAGDDYLCFYTCKAVGDVLMKFAEENPAVQFLVFCGHSHNEALYEPLSNLTVKTGHSEYYEPSIQEVFDLS
jgi:predicted phosphohydrolase